MAFPIRCSDCKKSFSISDEVYNRKVRGKVVTIKCKSCGAAIRVDGTQEAPRTTSAPAPAKKSGAAPPSQAEGQTSSAPLEAAKARMPTQATASTASGSASAGRRGEADPPKGAQATHEGAPARSAAAPAAARGTEAAAKKPLISSPTKPAATRRALDVSASSPGKAARRAGDEQTPAPALVGRAEAPAKGALQPKASADLPAAEQRKPHQDASFQRARVGAVMAPTTPKATPAQATPEPSPATRSAPNASGGPIQGDTFLWAVDYGESEHREMTTPEIAAELRSGAIDGQTLVWHDNMPDWLAISDVKELSHFVQIEKPKSKPKPPPAPKSSPKLPTPVRALPSVPKAAPPPPVGPLSSRSAGSKPTKPAASPSRPAASRPPAPPPKKLRSEAVDQDDVVTSARFIEADEPKPPAADPFAELAAAASPSVHGGASAGAGAFDLTQSPFGSPEPRTPSPAMAAAPVPTAPAPAAPPLPLAPAAAAPAAAANFSGQAFPAPPALPASGLANPPAPAAQTPFTPVQASQAVGLPAAPFPMSSSPIAGSSLTDDLEWPQARSKKPLVLGLLGVAAVAVLGWLLASGSSDETPAPSVNPETQAATPAPPSEPAPAPTPEPAAQEPSGEPQKEGGGEAEPAPDPAAGTKSGDFADLFERNAKGSR